MNLLLATAEQAQSLTTWADVAMAAIGLEFSAFCLYLLFKFM